MSKPLRLLRIRARAIVVPLVLLAGVLLAALPAVSSAQVALTSDMEKFSYGLGLQFGQQLRKKLVEQKLGDADPGALTTGILDILRGAEPRLSREVLQAAFKAMAIREVKVAEQKVQAEGNLEKGRQFMQQNKTENGVVALGSGGVRTSASYRR